MAPGEVIVCRGPGGDACVRRWGNASGADDAYSTAFNEVAGQVLTVAYDTLIPYVTFERRADGVVLTGYLGELWTILETTLGFRSVYVRANGNVARAMLQRGTADVYLSATVITTEEDDLYDHTQPVITHWYELFARKGLPEVSADSYVRAMTPSMWCLTLAALALLCVVLRALLWLRAALGMPPGVLPDTASLGSCALSVLGGLCSQGWQESPRCPSARVTVVTTLFFGYLMYNSYAAVLISHLASGHYAAPFSSLDEVVRKATHTLCVRNESYAYFSLLKRGPQWRRVLNRGVCREVSQAARLAEALCDRTEAVVLEIPSVMAAALESRPECQGEVLRVKNRMQRASASLLLRRGFPHVQAIDYMITRCRATGVLDRLEKQYLDGLAVQGAGATAGQDVGNTVTVGVQVTFEHVRWVLGSYACALAVPLLVLAAECLVAWRATASARMRTRLRRRRARPRPRPRPRPRVLLLA